MKERIVLAIMYTALVMSTCSTVLLLDSDEDQLRSMKSCRREEHSLKYPLSESSHRNSTVLKEQNIGLRVTYSGNDGDTKQR